MADHAVVSREQCLAARDVAFAAVSRAPLPEIQAFQARMGWKFLWVSSFDGDFNLDFHVSFPKDGRRGDELACNYGEIEHGGEELPGASAFYKDADGTVFHTYFTCARGLDLMVGTYNWLDIAPLGRNEGGLPHTMSWVRHHDKYE